MATIGVVAGVIVAAGTVAGGIISVAKWIFSRFRKAEKEDAYRARVATELEDLKRRLGEQ